MNPWKIPYKTTCFNCKKNVNQIVEIYLNQAFVKCENCGATRYYILRNTYIDEGNIIEEEKNRKSKYEPWLLETEIKCFNCEKKCIQDILITEYGLFVRCKCCKFTRHYMFHMINISK